jgi:DNA invertase Pin-like site-specific DNA recombinase
MKKLVGYLRVSGKGQIDGDGQQRQTLAVSEFCSQHAFECETFFFEAGVSGTVDGVNRPEFCRMLDFIQANQLDGFVVERMDRLARDLIVSETLLAECRKRGVAVYCADRETPIDVAAECTDPMQKFARQLFAAIAELEKSSLVVKLSVSRARIRAEKGRCEGAKPLGFYPKERDMFDMVLALRNGDACDWDSVVTLINQAGYRTRAGTEWTRPTLNLAYSRFTKSLTKNPSLFITS